VAIRSQVNYSKADGASDSESVRTFIRNQSCEHDSNIRI